MTLKVVRVVFVTLVLVVVAINAATRGATCFTPNNERATCIRINSCQSIKDAIVTRNTTAIDFAKRSQCGYDKEPLVCCGSTGYPISTLIFDVFNNSRQPSGAVTPLSHKLLPDASVCGLQVMEHKVFGGENTDLDEFPWTVLLKYRDDIDNKDAGFKCGGSLINNRYVLTAAHCLVLNPNIGISLDSVRLGEWRISTTVDCLGQQPLQQCSDPVLDIGIEKMVIHTSYRRRNNENDIALLRLKQTVVFTDFIRPICIPSPSSPSPAVGTNLLVAGWGATEYNSSSDVKQKVAVPLVSQIECSSKLTSRRKITEFQVCAGGVRGKDSCQGDSGGPLMRVVDEKAQWYLEGIISWGVGCGITGFPGIYTRVPKYTDWITSNIEE